MISASETMISSGRRATTSAPPAVELVLVGNGPGELQGWIAPVARAARALATATASTVRLTLAMTPTQFAGGRETEVVESWGLFDRILHPATTIRISLGLERCDVHHPGALIHLGGDLLLSAALAARLRLPSCAFAETTLAARRHRGFQRIFAANKAVARDLVARGVPETRVTVTGDPRGDALAGVVRRDGLTPLGTRAPIVSFLPGSRDRFFEILAPFFAKTAAALAGRIPGVQSQFIISEFLTPSIVSRASADICPEPGGPEIRWVTEQGWDAVARSDFAVTIPGTNTLELAMAAVPFAVVVPTQYLARMPLEGLLEWVARIPGLGYPLRSAGFRAYLRRERFLAIPNKRAGRAIAPEWIGTLQPQDVAEAITANR
ncbi:MAG TPA: hypothetical protein VI007_09905, partial [bacterium]